MRGIIERLIAGQRLSRDLAAQACQALCEGQQPSQAAALLALLAREGETKEELAGFADVMKHAMIRVPYSHPALDIVGTGGDGANTVNISTAAALVVASCGGTVIKHGNRASSSLCGSADFLEACGVALYTQPNQALHCLEQTQFVYLHKPAYHPLADHVKTLRQSLQIRTILNLLGPLLNPAEVGYLVLGVYTPEVMLLYADTLIEMGVSHAFVVHGSGLDELNCLGTNAVIEIVSGEKHAYELDPRDYGLPLCTIDALRGGTAEDNKRILSEVLAGRAPGAIAHTIALNAGVALYTLGVVPTIQMGIDRAQAAIADGAPYKKLQQIAEYFVDA